MNDQSYKKISLHLLVVLLFHSFPFLIKAQDINKIDLAESNTIKKSSTRAKLNNNTFYEIQKSNAQELIIELSIPDFKVEKSTHQGIDFLSINIPGYSQTNEPGKPQLPVKGFLFGIPPGSDFKLFIF